MNKRKSYRESIGVNRAENHINDLEHKEPKNNQSEKKKREKKMRTE